MSEVAQNKTVLKLLEAYVKHHNDGVVSGKFTPLFQLFEPKTEMIFVGSGFGPFRTKQEIINAFAVNPPDRQLEILATNHDDTNAEATYSWSGGDGKVAGVFGLETSDGSIVKVVVRQAPAG